MSSLAVVGAELVLTPSGSAPPRGPSLTLVDRRDEGVSIASGRIVQALDGDPDVVLDANGCTAVPGFVDPHTHILGAGAEGPVPSLARTLDIARAMLRAGTTTFEAKSGAPSVEMQLRELRLLAALRDVTPQEVSITCFAGDRVPESESQGGWAGRLATEVLPVAAAEGIVDACDLRVEIGALALEHGARLAAAAEPLGIAMRIHADQLADNQTASFAARWGFRSADHLNHTPREGVHDLAAGNTVAVLLPMSTVEMKQARRPLVRDLIDAGAIVAVGTDHRPGRSLGAAMRSAMAAACRHYGFTPEQALVASTAGGAAALGIQDGTGRLTAGSPGDVVILDVTSLDDLVRDPERDHVVAVVRRGEVAYLRQGDEDRLRRATPLA